MLKTIRQFNHPTVGTSAVVALPWVEQPCLQISAETRRLLFEDDEDEDFEELEAPAKVLDFAAFKARRAR
ncbi:MAG: hypothetical protein JWM80_1502 [Cyanobacteria bacterium RYN_339]|nr:hypothetical protein [Cyanobacteria bacterium RYN_339]